MLILTILFSLLLAACIFGFLVRWGDDGYSFTRATAVFLGGVGLLSTGVAALVLAGMIPSWVGAKYKAEIINREYGTTYTQAEIFHASSVIDTIRQLHRKRIEVNGNVLGHGEKE